MANLTQVLACPLKLKMIQTLTLELDWKKILAVLRSAVGVKKRFDHLAQINGIDIYEDFAHHPSAVQIMLESLKYLLLIEEFY